MATVLTWWTPPLTQEQQDTLFLLTWEDDTEEAAWMVMGDRQFWSASGFAHSLRIYVQQQRLPWYVAGMLPILFPRPGLARQGSVAPDILVALVPQRERTSYDLRDEGVFPAFVLEVVSPSSVDRDLQDKYRLYDLLGAQEYAIFTPQAGQTPLQGYRRAEDGSFVPWSLEGGRLYSAVLDLWLTSTVVEGSRIVQAVTPSGVVLLTPEQEAAARTHAEEEVARLRAEIEQLHRAE